MRTIGQSGKASELDPYSIIGDLFPFAKFVKIMKTLIEKGSSIIEETLLQAQTTIVTISQFRRFQISWKSPHKGKKIICLELSNCMLIWNS